MDLQATAQLLGNFGEFFGAIAVVFTLAYLAVQLRQSNQLAQSETHRAYVNDWNKSVLDPYYDPTVRGVLNRGISDFEQLTNDDKRIFTTWLASLVHLGEELFIQSKKGLVDPQVVAVMDKRLTQNILEPGTAACWNSIKVAYDEEFVGHVDDLLRNAGDEGSVTSTIPWFQTDR